MQRQLRLQQFHYQQKGLRRQKEMQLDHEREMLRQRTAYEHKIYELRSRIPVVNALPGTNSCSQAANFLSVSCHNSSAHDLESIHVDVKRHADQMPLLSLLESPRPTPRSVAGPQLSSCPLHGICTSTSSVSNSVCMFQPMLPLNVPPIMAYKHDVHAPQVCLQTKNPAELASLPAAVNRMKPKQRNHLQAPRVDKYVGERQCSIKHWLNMMERSLKRADVPEGERNEECLRFFCS